MQQKMSDPANCMDGCDWVEDAVAMYKKGLTAGDFEKLKDLAQESNGDLAATSELRKLEQVRFMDNVAIPSQGSDSVRTKRLMRRLVQNDFFSWFGPQIGFRALSGRNFGRVAILSESFGSFLGFR